MQNISIIGYNYIGKYENTRTACRCIIINDGKMLLSYESLTDTYMLPGGGLEGGESEDECCIREVAEETGFIVEILPCALEVDEYYKDYKYINRYFFGTVVGKCEIKLTASEAAVGMKPVWLPVRDAVDIFSKYALYSSTDEMRLGLYHREYTALENLRLSY